MKKFRFAIFLYIGAFLLGGCTGYEQPIRQKDEDVKKVWSSINTVYKKRAEMVPELLAPFKSYSSIERPTLDFIKTSASAVSLSGKYKDACDNREIFMKFEENQNAMTDAFLKILLLSEKYPAIKNDPVHIANIAKLKEIEVRTQFAKNLYDRSAEDLNRSLDSFFMTYANKWYYKVKKKSIFTSDTPKIFDKG